MRIHVSSVVYLDPVDPYFIDLLDPDPKFWIMYPVSDPDPYYLSKNQIGFRKNFNILKYFMIHYLFDIIFS